MRQRFDRLATRAGRLAGSPWAFGLAVLVIVFWAVSGPFLHFSDTWQLIINTGTTLVTFLMVFLIQNTQNRTDDAINLKLDELLGAIPEASTDMALRRLEQASEDELRAIQIELERRLRHEP
jgi:low affinity Fe/Cu permease